MITDEDVTYDGLAGLPAFNPDDDTEPLPGSVTQLRAQIAAQESARRPAWTRLSEWLATEFCRPQWAASVVTLGLLLSVGTAYRQAQDANATVGQQLEARYMETINPLAHASHSR